MESPGRPDNANNNNHDSFRRFGNDAKSRSQAKNPVLAPISTPPRTPRVESLGQTLDKLSVDKERSGRTVLVSKPAGPSPAGSQRGARPGPMRVTRPITPKVNSLQSTLELLASDKERSDQLLELERSRLQALADAEASASCHSFAPRHRTQPEASALLRAAAEGAIDGKLEQVLDDLRAVNDRAQFVHKPSVGTWLGVLPSRSMTQAGGDGGRPAQPADPYLLGPAGRDPWANLYKQFPDVAGRVSGASR